MGWRRIVHRVTGLNMTQTVILSKGEVRIEVITDRDGESPHCAALYKFGQLVDEIHQEPEGIAPKVKEWIELHQP